MIERGSHSLHAMLTILIKVWTFGPLRSSFDLICTDEPSKSENAAAHRLIIYLNIYYTFICLPKICNNYKSPTLGSSTYNYFLYIFQATPPYQHPATINLGGFAASAVITSDFSILLFVFLNTITVTKKGKRKLNTYFSFSQSEPFSIAYQDRWYEIKNKHLST